MHALVLQALHVLHLLVLGLGLPENYYDKVRKYQTVYGWLVRLEEVLSFAAVECFIEKLF